MTSTLKIDTVTTLDGTGNITFSRPIVADVSNVTGTLPAINGSNLTGVGKVLQVVGNTVTAMTTGTTITPGDDTIPQITEGNQVLSQVMTASNTNNTVVVQALVTWEGSVNQNKIIAFHNTAYHATNAFACSNMHAADTGVWKQHSLLWIGNAFTTSASTYTVRCGMSGAGTMTFNGVSGSRVSGGAASCTLTVMEISA